MQMRRNGRILVIALQVLVCGALWAQEAKAPFRAEHYQIEAELLPREHQVLAKARIRIKPNETITTAAFELNANLKVTRALGADGKPLTFEATEEPDGVRVDLGKAFDAGQTTEITIEYGGTLATAERSPVSGLMLAYVGEQGSYLLYPARWFPIAGYPYNRFSSKLRITLPEGERVIATGRPVAVPRPTGRAVAGKTTFAFEYERESFPASVVAGRYEPVPSGTTTFYVFREHTGLVLPYGETVEKLLAFYSDKFGPLPDPTLAMVEIPDGSLPAYTAPGMVMLASRSWDPKVNYKMVAHEIAHLWWRCLVSPATASDVWLDEGFARYAEALYVENVAGQAALEQTLEDMTVQALLHEQSSSIRNAGRLPEFSPEFRSVVYQKGGAVLHMLRGIVGDELFFASLRQFAHDYAFRGAHIEDFKRIVEKAANKELSHFFTQWIDSTGVPEFHLEYVIYRTQKGFKVVGKIRQDLETFRMPVELKVETEGQPEIKQIEVVGTNSDFTIDTFGKPLKIIIDPANRLLKFNPQLRIRTAVARGEELVEQSDLVNAIKEFQKALEVNRQSSLAHFRIGEAFFEQRNYQAAANAFREAINGDNEPKWTEVWSHIYLGKIFDLTGQRERAVAEYDKATKTNDNTQGALDEARKYLEEPYKQETPERTLERR